MKRSLEVKLADEYDRRLRALPDFIAQFAQEVENKYSQTSIVSYLKDYTTFMEYLLLLPDFQHRKDIQDITLDDFKSVTKEDILGFLSYLTRFKKTFRKKNGELTSQWFTNDRIGKSRKLASVRTLYQSLSRNHSNGVVDVTQHIDISVKRTRKIKDRLASEDIDCLSSTIIDDANIVDSRSQKLHEKNKARDLTIVMILAFTGIRVSELVQLDIQDVSLLAQAIRVIRKGGDEDIVTIPDEIMPQLEEYHAQRLKMPPPDVLSKDAFFLSSHRKRIDAATIRSLLSKYRDRSGIDIEITPHTIRRTYGTHLLEVTGNIQLVADALGHSSVETTRKHYAETSFNRKQSTAKRFSYHNENPPSRKSKNE